MTMSRATQEYNINWPEPHNDNFTVDVKKTKYICVLEHLFLYLKSYGFEVRRR